MSNFLQNGDLLKQFVQIRSPFVSASISRWFRVNPPSGGPTVVDTLAASVPWWTTYLFPHMGANTYTPTVSSYVYRGGSLLEYVEQTFPPTTTTGNPSALPPAVSVLISFRPSLGRPRRVSRMYLPHVRRDYFGPDGLLTIPAFTTLAAFAALFTANIAWPLPGKLIRVRPCVRYSDTGNIDPITNATVHATPAGQLRRNRVPQKRSWL